MSTFLKQLEQLERTEKKEKEKRLRKAEWVTDAYSVLFNAEEEIEKSNALIRDIQNFRHKLRG